MNQKLLLPIVFSIILLSIPVNQAYGHHCDITHLKDCIEDGVKDVVKPLIDGVKDEVKAVEKSITKDVDIVKTDVERIENKVDKIEKTLDDDLITAVRDIEKEIVTIEKDVASVENAVVNDLTSDIVIIKKDIAKIERLIVSVERIEKRVVDTTESVIKAIIGDVKTDFVYIIYGLLALGAAYVVIRIIQFAIWLKAYLRDDGIEYYAKAQVAQNKEIISLLLKLVDKKS